MECKVYKSNCICAAYCIGIYPEWNVKYHYPNYRRFYPKYWNISRMECKDYKNIVLSRLEFIGIYPEWNVKKKTEKGEVRKWRLIGIYPEWNVKVYALFLYYNYIL